MGRYENAAIFHDTEAMCKAHPRLKEAIAFSRTNQRLILEGDKVVVPPDLSGMHWSLKGAEALLPIRALYKSGRLRGQ